MKATSLDELVPVSWKETGNCDFFWLIICICHASFVICTHTSSRHKKRNTRGKRNKEVLHTEHDLFAAHLPDYKFGYTSEYQGAQLHAASSTKFSCLVRTFVYIWYVVMIRAAHWQCITHNMSSNKHMRYLFYSYFCSNSFLSQASYLRIHADVNKNIFLFLFCYD